MKMRAGQELRSCKMDLRISALSVDAFFPFALDSSRESLFVTLER
jgi:hypothetical protein